MGICKNSNEFLKIVLTAGEHDHERDHTGLSWCSGLKALTRSDHKMVIRNSLECHKISFNFNPFLKVNF